MEKEVGIDGVNYLRCWGGFASFTEEPSIDFVF